MADGTPGESSGQARISFPLACKPRASSIAGIEETKTGSGAAEVIGIDDVRPQASPASLTKSQDLYWVEQVVRASGGQGVGKDNLAFRLVSNSEYAARNVAEHRSPFYGQFRLLMPKGLYRYTG